MDDQRLLERIVLRDQDAMMEIYGRYGDLVFSVVYRVLNDQGSAEESMQDAFMKVWQNISQFDAQRGSFVGWLVGIARNTAVDRLRQFNRQQARDQNPAPNDESEEGELSSYSPRLIDDWQDREQADSLRRAMEALPLEQFQVLDLSYFGGMTQADIADQLRIPLGTVKTRMRLGLQKLREAWLKA
jgi:RNA polymerase sigma-70 factor (ECF subfamily)